MYTKQKGGYCCLYEKNGTCARSSRKVYPPEDEKNRPRLAGNVTIGRKILTIYFKYHAFKHMEDVGLHCYDEAGIIRFLKNVIPEIHVASNKGYISKKYASSKISESFITNRLNQSYSVFTGVVIDNSNGQYEYYKIVFSKHQSSTTDSPAIEVFAIYKGVPPKDINNVPKNNYINNKNDMVGQSNRAITILAQPIPTKSKSKSRIISSSSNKAKSTGGYLYRSSKRTRKIHKIM